MMKKLIAGMGIFFLSMLVIESSVAAPATESSIRELMTETGMANIGVTMMKGMIPQFKAMVHDVPESFWDDFIKEVKPDDLVKLIIPIYQKHYSEEDIQEVLKFYRSPTGKKFIANIPQVVQEGQMAGRKWGEELGRKVIEKAKKAQAK
jgi:uncharacterized protein